jgi:2-oxoglutarate/2-oxoacid ferredoxin oxidoreductase subunit alpha
MARQEFDYTLLIGGQAGQGMQTVGVLLANALLQQGQWLTSYQSYQSRIRGGHNFYQVRLASQPVHSLTRGVDILVALDQNTLAVHASELTPRGVAVFDADRLQAPPGVNALPVPIGEVFPAARTTEVFINSVFLGVLAGLMGAAPEIMHRPLERSLGRKGAEVLEQNQAAVAAGWEFVQRNPAWREKFPAPRPEQPLPTLSLEGNEAVALGAAAAGCKFYTAYPMTPASSVLEILAGYAEDLGMVVEQAEDEIAALNMVLGASFAGVRAMTGTSGGGFALMVEALSLAGMIESPAVILLGQRPGPATGLPTRTEQGELEFALHAGHGEFPRVLLAPGTLEECFRLTTHAFNLADHYQVPAFILTDQYLADVRENVAPFDLGAVRIDRGKLVKAEAGYQRYALTADGVSPRAVPGSGPGLVIADSDEHTEDGHLTEDLAVRKAMVEKRLRKLTALAAESLPPTVLGPARGAQAVVCWGSTFGGCRDAVARLQSQGRDVALFHFSQVWPLDREKLRDRFSAYGKVMVVENNATGQFARLLRAEGIVAEPVAIGKYDGLPFFLEDVLESLAPHLR